MMRLWEGKTERPLEEQRSLVQVKTLWNSVRRAPKLSAFFYREAAHSRLTAGGAIPFVFPGFLSRVARAGERVREFNDGPKSTREMRMRIYSVGTVVTLMLPAFVQAREGASFLLISPSAREQSLGAGTALGRGSDALFYNPAGIRGRNVAFSLSHAQLPLETRLNAFSAKVPLRDSTLGLGFRLLSQDALAGRDAAGGKTGNFSAYDAAADAAWAFSYEGWDLGAGIRMIRQHLAGTEAQGTAADLGVQRVGSWGAAGLSLRNLGGKMKFLDESFSLPATVGLGAELKPVDALNVRFGLEQRLDSDERTVSAGLEIGLGSNAVLRTGYGDARNLSESAATDALARFGFGFGWMPEGRTWSLDYAASPGDPNLGLSHRVSIGWRFGEPAFNNEPFGEEPSMGSFLGF